MHLDHSSLSRMLRWRQQSCLTMRDDPCDDGQDHLATDHQFACCTVVCLCVIGLCALPVHRAQRGFIGVSPYTVLTERRPAHTHRSVRSFGEGFRLCHLHLAAILELNPCAACTSIVQMHKALLRISCSSHAAAGSSVADHVWLPPCCLA